VGHDFEQSKEHEAIVMCFEQLSGLKINLIKGHFVWLHIQEEMFSLKKRFIEKQNHLSEPFGDLS
jgi:hypothetical protein